MKVSILVLLFCSGALSELPPPYLRQDFRPSPQEYRPQSQPIKTIDVKIPSKLTIEQLIKLTEQLQNSQERIVNRPQKIQVTFGQNSYLPPSRPAQQTGQFPQQDSYLPPSKQPQQIYRPPGQQNTYLPPQKQPEQVYRPPGQFRPPFNSQTQNGQTIRPQNSQNPSSFSPGQNTFASQNTQNIPQNQFVPIQQQPQRPSSFRPQGLGSTTAQNQFIAPQTARPQNQYGPPQSPNSQGLPEKLQNSQQSFPQATYGVPSRELSGSVSNNQQRPPATNYGVPENRPFETLGEQKTDEEILRQRVLDALKKQHLPYKPASGFKPDGVNQQYLPSGGEVPVGQFPQNSFEGNRPGSAPGGGVFNRPSENPDVTNRPVGGNVGQNYLPPKGTPENGFNSKPTTARPVTEASPEGVDGLSKPDKEENPQQTTDQPLSQDGSTGGPNISIANAVAGAPNFFYLQQPDGRLQKVILEKTREPNSKPEEYVANYYFQNIQALPNVVYTPLVTLDYTQS